MGKLAQDISADTWALCESDLSKDAIYYLTTTIPHYD